MDFISSYLEKTVNRITKRKVKLKNKTQLSLQELCLLSVEMNLKDFCVAYSATSNTTLQKNFHFLQRQYSTQLMEMLDGKQMSDFHLNLLVNEYLEEINIGQLYDLDHKTVIKQFEKVGHVFLKVDFDAPFLEESSSRAIELVNAIVQHLPNVKILQLDFHSSDETLRIVSTVCHELEELCISYSKVTAEALKLCFKPRENYVMIVPLDTLRKLSLYNPRYSTNDIKVLLRNRPYLQFLGHDKLLKALVSLCVEDKLNSVSSSVSKYKLTNICFDFHDDMTAALSSIAEACPFVRTLEVTMLNQTNLELLCRFTQLEDLTIGCDLDLNNLLKSIGHRLKRLAIDGCSLSLPILIQYCPNLESLFLSGTNVQISVPNNDITDCLSKLVELELTSMYFFSQCLEMIFKSAPNLEKLSFLGFKELKVDEFKSMFLKFCETSRLNFLFFENCYVAEKDFLTSIILAKSLIQTVYMVDCPNIGRDELKILNSILQKSGKSIEIVWSTEDTHSESDFSESE